MRILIAIGLPRQKEAGAAGVVLHHAEELKKRGHDVDCWFLEDVLVRPVRWKRFEALCFASSLARRVLKDRLKYHVVNIHAPWGCAYGMWRKVFRLRGAPVYVMTMHGSEGRYVEAMRDEHRKGRATNFGWKNRAWHRAYHQLMFEGSIKTADFGLVVSREGQRYAEQICNGHGGRLPARERFGFLPNGVEESFFVPRVYGCQTAPRLLFVGTWLDRKGVFYLAEAFGILARSSPEARLTVAGCVASEERVKSFFAPEVQPKVDVSPFIARVDMPALYAKHDIFILPSLVEGMPLSLLEAMASGMPIVTTRTGGMLDMIEDGVDGLLVLPADAKGLAKAVERLIRSAELRTQLGQAAQERVREQTWEHATRTLEEKLILAALNSGRQEEARVAANEQHRGERN